MALIGINVTERTDQGIPALAGSNEMVLGILGVTERGPQNKPVLITGEAEFKRIFGDNITTGYAAYAYTGYRLNGGRQAYVVRTFGTGGAAASVTLSDRAATPIDTLKIEAGYRGSVDKSAWGNDLTVTIANNASNSALFDLTILLSGTVKEIWRGLTPGTAETALNNVDNGSEFVKLTNLASATAAPDNNPTVQSATALTGGSDPAAPATADLQGNSGGGTGLYAFDPKEITHLICPEAQDSTFQGSLEDYCATRGTITGIVSLPVGTAVSAAAAAGVTRQETISYSACYFGWISVIDPIGTVQNPVKTIPADGHVAGMYARVWRSRGIHKAPAGVIDGSLRGAIGVDVDVINDTNLTTLADSGINAIRSIPGYGVVVMVSRTLSKDTRWRYVNVRNLFNFIKRELKSGLMWVQQEPNDARLRRKVAKDVVLPFMLGLHKEGAFGSGRPADLFTILCDETNNSQTEIDLGNFHLDISLYPSKPAETVEISISQQRSGASQINEG
jgi:phage tail sheath protein FI